MIFFIMCCIAAIGFTSECIGVIKYLRRDMRIQRALKIAEAVLTR